LVLRFLPRKEPWIHSDFNQVLLYSAVLPQHVRQSFQLRFNVVAPFEILLRFLRKDVNLDEVLKSLEKPDFFEKQLPRLPVILLRLLGLFFF
jgi:hypothetical protein